VLAVEVKTLKKMRLKMKTKKEALIEYQFLLNDDPDFEHQWCDTLKDFYEWCSNYDDLKHITKGE
jgi:hypothetical protein